ncbi:hypothetical protein ATX23_09345 [Oenococcus oeni]|uniref:DUF7013 family protein n=1 Tax=Oenococcus oeni TaxID=1247 RepID=UPI0008F86AAE|nr:hypothetical protein [Oenococcus oeni]OIL58301.1 hypothetical protein ATX23_09345 [Oenococcus oeni]
MCLVVISCPALVSKFGLTINGVQNQTQSYTVYEPTVDQYNNASYIDPNGIYKIQPDAGDPIYMLGTTAIDVVTDESGNVIYNRNLFLRTSGLTALTTTSWATLIDTSKIFNPYIKTLGNISGLVMSFITNIPSNATVGEQISLQLKGQKTGANNQSGDNWNTITGYGTCLISTTNLGTQVKVNGPISIDTNASHTAYQDWNDALSQTVAIYVRSDSSIASAPVSNFKLSIGSNSSNWCFAPEDIITVQSTSTSGVIS